jgi:hypothetical protein
MSRHSFSGDAVATTLNGGINSSVTTCTIGASTGWPNTATGPFVIVIDQGTASEEKCLVSAYSSTTISTMSRGYDGTTATAHSNGAAVEHCFDATQFDLHDGVIAGVGTSTPSTSAVGDAAADGTAVTTPAAGDHKHAREAFGSPGNSAPGDTATNGSATTLPRSDHKHGRESYATIATGVIDTTLGDITTSLPGDSGLAGAVGKAADAGHKHPREASLLRLFATQGNVSVNNGTTVAPAGSGMTTVGVTGTWAAASPGFTVPSAGLYLALGSVDAGSIFAGLVGLQVNIVSSATVWADNPFFSGTGWGAYSANTSGLIVAGATDTIGVSVYQANGTTELVNVKLQIVRLALT